MTRVANCLIALLLFIASSCSYHQPTEKEDTAYWNQAFVDSAQSLLYKDHDTTRALQFFDSAIQQSSSPTVYPRASRFVLLANYYYFFSTDNYATARMIDSALAFYHSKELQNRYPVNYVHLLLFGGQIAYRLTQYSKANEYYFKAKNIADAHLTPCQRTAYSYSIAMVLYRQQNFAQALNYFKEAYSLQESCAPQTTAVVLQQQEIQSNIGLCYIELKNYDSAMVHFDNALSLANLYKDSLGKITLEKIYGVIYGNKAKVAMNKGDLKAAESFSLKAIALNDRDGYEKEYAQSVKLNLAEIYNRSKNFEGMLQQLQSVDEKILQSTAPLRKEWNSLMASYYEQVAQPALAIRYLKTYFSLNDSIATQQKKLTEADVTRQLKDKEQQLQISILKKDNEVARAWLWLTVLVALMAGLIMYLVYRNYRRSKKSLVIAEALNAEIEKQKTAREEEAKQRHKLITEAVIRAQENERSHIGLELHDNINQVLTTVKLQNEMVLNGVVNAQAILPKSVQYLQASIDEIRSLSRRLSAPTLGKISLQESVKDLIDSINATSKVKISRTISGFDNEALQKELHLGVYRILQEQLNNILKHSEATEVMVRIERCSTHLRLWVTDNGKGFAPKNARVGLGLVNMQTRAESLNGTLKLESRPGEGCSLRVELPCELR